MKRRDIKPTKSSNKATTINRGPRSWNKMNQEWEWEQSHDIEWERRNMKERVNVEWVEQFLQSLGAKQIKKWRDEAMHLISRPKSKIPEAAATEILEDYIMLWMDRRHICENNMKNERKATTAASWCAIPKRAFHSQSPSVHATSNNPHPNTTNAMQYSKWIDEFAYLINK
jgi:hypothetical protein